MARPRTQTTNKTATPRVKETAPSGPTVKTSKNADGTITEEMIGFQSPNLDRRNLVFMDPASLQMLKEPTAAPEAIEETDDIDGDEPEVDTDEIDGDEAGDGEPAEE